LHVATIGVGNIYTSKHSKFDIIFWWWGGGKGERAMAVGS